MSFQISEMKTFSEFFEDEVEGEILETLSKSLKKHLALGRVKKSISADQEESKPTDADCIYIISHVLIENGLLSEHEWNRMVGKKCKDIYCYIMCFK